MSDAELNHLLEANKRSKSTNIEDPLIESLKYLENLELDNQSFDMLLGSSPGLNWPDFSENINELYYRLLLRAQQLICHDDDLIESIEKSISVGLEAIWLALLSAFGVSVETLAAKALKPIAVAIAIHGLQKICLI